MINFIIKPKIRYVIGKTYYINNTSKSYLIWELIGFDICKNIAYLRHPETKLEHTTQLSFLKTTNRLNNHPYYEKQITTIHKKH